MCCVCVSALCAQALCWLWPSHFPNVGTRTQTQLLRSRTLTTPHTHTTHTTHHTSHTTHKPQTTHHTPHAHHTPHTTHHTPHTTHHTPHTTSHTTTPHTVVEPSVAAKLSGRCQSPGRCCLPGARAVPLRGTVPDLLERAQGGGLDSARRVGCMVSRRHHEATVGWLYTA